MIKLNPEILNEYKGIAKNISIINKNSKMIFISRLNEAIKKKDRAIAFQVIADIEDWLQREKFFIRSNLMGRKK